MTWIANVLLIVAAASLSPRRRWPFVLTFLGEGIWVVESIAIRRADLAFVCHVFGAIALYKLIFWETQDADSMPHEPSRVPPRPRPRRARRPHGRTADDGRAVGQRAVGYVRLLPPRGRGRHRLPRGLLHDRERNMATTFQDLIDHLVDYIGGNPSDALQRDAKRAILEAYRDLTNAHNWSYLFTHGRIACIPPYDGIDPTTGLVISSIQYQQSSGANPYMVTLTGDVWPEWAVGAYLRVGMCAGKVVQRLSATVLLLDPQVNFGADLPAGTCFCLYRDSYLLPEDFVAQDQSLYERNFGGMSYVHPREWLYESRYVFAQGQPQEYTVTGDTLYPGRLLMRVCPFPTDARSIDFLYKRRPRPLAITQESRGTVSMASGASSITGVGTYFTPAMVGSFVRLSSSTVPPTNLVDTNPAAFETYITGVIDATHASTADPAPAALSGVAFTVSDPCDIEEGAMVNAMFRCVEKCIAQNRTIKDKPSALAQYTKQLNEARSADSRSFTGRHEGQRTRFRQRMSDMPQGPDDIN